MKKKILPKKNNYFVNNNKEMAYKAARNNS